MLFKDYRAQADRHLQWVRETDNSDERRVYLKLARTYLDAALTKEGIPPNLPPAPRLPYVSFPRGGKRLGRFVNRRQLMQWAIGREGHHWPFRLRRAYAAICDRLWRGWKRHPEV